jgi:hypothetical protein
LQVRTKLSGSFFTGVEAFLHIHRLKDGCATDYLGAVELKNDLTQLGIAPGQPAYLVFVFQTSSRLRGSFTQTSYTTILTPRPGGQYTADVSYADRMYNVSIRELGPRGTPGREIERRTRNCPKTD